MEKISCDIVTKIGSHNDLLKRLKHNDKINYFLINIDNFSNLNCAYGYEMGDEILCQVLKYIDIVKPNEAELFQYTSDKFVFIDSRDLDKYDLIEIAEEVLSFFSQADITVNKTVDFNISVSIGISVGVGLVNIMNSEMAIKEARESKRNHFHIYDDSSEFIQNSKKNLYWILKIREAVTNENIIAYFQPIINNRTGKVEKYECLARINDADEIISPYMFMDAARMTGNLSYVTKSLITQSFKKFSGTEYDFSINITGTDFLLEYLEFFLLKNAKKYNIDPSHVVLEMLEDITSLDKGNILYQLQSLREKGFKIAIDDFGAENSNMSRLLEIHPDYLKIDGAFIKNIVTDRNSQLIVEAIVNLCNKSGITVIAEFVHNEDVQKYVKDLGIEYSQGYHFGKPSPDLITL